MGRTATGSVRILRDDAGKRAWHGKWTRADGTRSGWLPLPGNIPLDDEAAAKACAARMAPKVRAASQVRSLNEQDHLGPLDPPEIPGVYVIQGVNGFVKIGRAKNIAKRIKDIQVGHPVPLRLLAILDHDPETEDKYHRRFGSLRASGEWFHFIGHLRKAVLAIRTK